LTITSFPFCSLVTQNYAHDPHIYIYIYIYLLYYDIYIYIYIYVANASERQLYQFQGTAQGHLQVLHLPPTFYKFMQASTGKR
jgi:hypothetical protein